MSDQQAPAERDTPAVAGPDQAPGTAQEQAEVDWQKRYNDLQPEYTRTTQSLREAEQKQQWYDLLVTSDDPDTQRQAAKALGYDLPDPEEGEGEVDQPAYDDPYDELRTELHAVRERLESRDQEAMVASQQDFITDYAHAELEKLGVTDPEDQLWIFERSLSQPWQRTGPGGPVSEVPDIAAAYQQFEAWETERQKRWAKTKRAPSMLSGGQTANEVPNPGTGHNARMDRAMRAIQDSGE